MNKIILFVFMLGLMGCGGESGSSPAKAKAASADSCPDYYEALAKTCKEVLYGDLDISCRTLFIKGSTAASQKEGKLFTDPNGKVSASDMGNSICASSHKSLNRKVEKAKRGKKKNWGPQCTAFIDKLNEKCVTPVAAGEFPDGCSTYLSQVNTLKRNAEPEGLCQSYSQSL